MVFLGVITGYAWTWHLIWTVNIPIRHAYLVISLKSLIMYNKPEQMDILY